MNKEKERVERLTKILLAELFNALGLSQRNVITRLLTPISKKPINRFSKICVGFDQRVIGLGFQAASKWIMKNFAPYTSVFPLPSIPSKGPLLIVSNHPGAYDSLVISSHIPRDDLKIVVNIPLDFITEIPSTLTHFLYAPHDAFIRMNVVRSAITHLKSGGSLLLFASGQIDPDPSTMVGAEKELVKWSRSVELILRKVPEAILHIAIVSNILNPRYINHFLTRFRSKRPDKQRISEFIQVMDQMRTPARSQLIPKLTFSKPFTYKQIFEMDEKSGVMETIHSLSRQLLGEHYRFTQ
jgi:hypothetical protein